MPKNLENVVEIFDGNIDLVTSALSEGKTIIMAVNKGPLANKSIETGYSEFFDAQVDFKEDKENAGTCACGEPADCLVYMWRENK
ncbi:hypothetical protein [Spiroplasma endosymbiont of Eupeodes luniger]|uniref:hypothetical protein n=1 Tax=Spiroplasma endosymbiont of Eupeodes luniger TaxID=3066300 RepID=UPI0030CC11E8